MSSTHSADRPRTSRLRRWRVALVPVAIVTPIALTACGGSDDSSAAASSGNSSQSSSGESAQGQGQGGPSSQELQAYMSCLQEHGVTVDLPEGGEGRPGGGEMGEPPADGEVPQPPADGEMPQPPADGEVPDGGQGGPGGGGPGGGGFMGLDTSDATVKAAMESCSDLQPQMPQGGPQGQGPQRQDGGQQGQQDGRSSDGSTDTTVAN